MAPLMLSVAMPGEDQPCTRGFRQAFQKMAPWFACGLSKAPPLLNSQPRKGIESQVCSVFVSWERGMNS